MKINFTSFHLNKKYLFLFWLLFTVSNYAQTLGDFTDYSIEGKKVTIHTTTGSVQLIFYQADILKIDFLPESSSQIDSSFVVVRDTTEVVDLFVNDTPSLFDVISSSIIVSCHKNPLRFRFFDASGQLLLREPTAGGLEKVGKKRKATFTLKSNYHFYGTGERGMRLDLTGTAFSSYNTQHYGYHDVPATMNINIPFLATANGFALYFDNTYPGHFDLGAGDPQVFEYSVDGGELSYFLIAGESIEKQLENYTWLTGRQPMPPKWALGYIQSKYGYRNETAARNMVQTMREKHIPCDAIVLDLYWFQHMGDINWNYANFQQPFQMMSDFLDQGLKTIVITEPYIVEYSHHFSEGFQNGYFAKTNQGDTYLLNNWWSCGCDAALLDITNPEAQNWWWSKHPDFFGDQLAGIWTDLCEPERHPFDMVHHLGSAEKVHNIYNLLWAKTISEGYANFRPDSRLFNLTRSGFAGIQRYGVLPWTGDVGASFAGLAAQVPLMLNTGLSGLAYLHSDIGGFCCGTTTPELYIRWLQFGTFSGVMRAHGVDYQPQEPWGYGTQAEQIAKKFIQLRYQLLPYNYTLAYENHTTGKPIARPLFFEDPDNSSLFNEYAAYFWGSSILVAPVLKNGVRSKNVPLATGEWIDFWSDVLYAGNQTVNVAAPLDRIPLFIKNGSIIPMQPVMNYTDELPADTLYLHIYPQTGNESAYELYEDDGKTLAYQRGEFAVTEFRQQITEQNENMILTINIGVSEGDYAGKPLSRSYLTIVHRTSEKPSSATVNQNQITEQQSYSELRASETGFYYDPVENKLYIQTLTHPENNYEITVEQLSLSGVNQKNSRITDFRLGQNYPNPFNSSTSIPYSVPQDTRVFLKIYNMLGDELFSFDRGLKEAGQYVFNFNSDKLSSGLYFYQLKANKYTSTRKFLLLK